MQSRVFELLFPRVAALAAWTGLLLWARRSPGAEGAGDQWALAPVVLPAVPQAAGCAETNPIDGFVGALLAGRGIEPAPRAERRTLLRRVTFDLTGLPPTLEELESFERDPDPGAYDRVVDRLLASPRFGERWARHWLDVAHFAETHGHDQDRIREHAWPYRDYLVEAFNEDRPYTRFVEDQVAADVLHPEDPAAVRALGFLAAGPWDESSLRDIREDTEDRKAARYLDRDDMVTTVLQSFASVTVQCARCHDHKFDPVPTADYYALQAVFAGVDRANRRFEPDAAVAARRRGLAGELLRVEKGERSLLLSREALARAAAWETELGRRSGGAVLFEPDTFSSTGGATLVKQGDGSLLATGARPERDTYVLSGPAPSRITGVELEVLTDSSLPQGGPGRADNGNLHLSEVVLELHEPGARSGRRIPLGTATADFDQDGWTCQKAVDGDESTAWGIHPQEGMDHAVVLGLASPLDAPAGSRIALHLKQLHGGSHLLGRLRVHWIAAPDLPPPSVLPAEVRAALQKPQTARGDAEWIAISRHLERLRLGRELASLPPPALVYAAASDFEPDGGHKPAGGPRLVEVLFRGDIHQPRGEALPGALSCLKELPAQFALENPANEGARRAALARWLTSPKNPLVWRSIVNRVWHFHFGRGIVDTPNDLGRMGGKPTHPELLDFLAAHFRDGGGSLKDLHRLIVMSDAYCRSAHIPAAARALDEDNHLLARRTSLRLDAESLRDAILFVAGDLDFRMGGPSDRQFDLRPGIHVTPTIDYARFDVTSAAGRRRSIYRFLFRTLPDPVMDALDCPAGDQLTPVRNASVTVQQALALWNGDLVLAYAERFAARVRSARATLRDQVELAFRSALGRTPGDGEREELEAHASRHGLASACRLIFNLNEFAFVE